MAIYTLGQQVKKQLNDKVFTERRLQRIREQRDAMAARHKLRERSKSMDRVISKDGDNTMNHCATRDRVEEVASVLCQSNSSIGWSFCFLINSFTPKTLILIEI